jgi:hypothetical protein
MNVPHGYEDKLDELQKYSFWFNLFVKRSNRKKELYPSKVFTWKVFLFSLC